MSLNGIAASALSALKTNSAALGVVSNNVTNLNTPGYARRVVNQTTLSASGQLLGVTIGSVQRVVDQFLNQESLSASGASSQYGAQADMFSQLNGLLGGPGDNQSLTTSLSNLQGAFATASQAPTAAASATGVANALTSLAGTISNVSGTISDLQGQIDHQVVSAITSVNSLIKQVYDLNIQVKQATAGGDTASGLSDQRDVAIANLAKTIGIKATPQSDGSINISTADGINLVGNTYATLSYAGGASNGVYGNIKTQDINPQNGQLIGQPMALDPHLGGGSLKGLIDMRDQTLGGLAQSIGNLAQGVAQAFNAQTNANAAYPPPANLTGRNTGLMGADALNFSGKTTIAVTSATGDLVSRVDVNFGGGTLSVNGGSAISIGTTVASFTAALNTALGSGGSVNFTDGKLSISATGGNGIVVQDDASTPSARGGTQFSQFFGLNDVFQSSAPSLLATGLSSSDASGLAAGGVIAMSLKGPDGSIVKATSITTTAGQTVGQVISALNTALGGTATLTLNADGSVSQSVSALYSGYQVNVTGDSTQRGTTGTSFTQLLGIGDNQLANQALSFGLTAAVATSPQRIGFTTPGITPSTVAGNNIMVGGDSSGAIALESVLTKSRSFSAAGGLAGMQASLADYAAAFYQNVSTQSNVVTSAQATQDDRYAEAQSRLTSDSGVNLDEELTNLTTYQQAYAAGARLLSVVDQLYDTLLQIQ